MEIPSIPTEEESLPIVSAMFESNTRRREHRHLMAEHTFMQSEVEVAHEMSTITVATARGKGQHHTDTI